MKKVLVIISEAPSALLAEKLRMAVGLTLDDDNKVTIAMIDDGVFATSGVDPELAGFEITKHLDTLVMMKHAIVAHQPSMETRGVTIGDGSHVQSLDGPGFATLLGEADVVL